MVPLELPVIQAHKGLKELVDEMVPQVGAVNVQSVRQKKVSLESHAKSQA